MKLAIFGATGGTGQQVAKQALAAGHEVTVLVRDPARLQVQHEKLYIVIGNVLDEKKVEEAVAGSEAVVISLGNTPNNPDMVVSDGTKNILAAMKKQGISRVVAVTSLGVGDSKEQVSFGFKMLMKTALRKAMEDKERQEKLMRNSDLDWIIVRPGGLTNDPPTGDYTFGVDKEIVAGQISRADVADFVLKQLQSDTFLHQTPAVT